MGGKCPKGIFWSSKLQYWYNSLNIYQELPISQALCCRLEILLSINSIYLVNLILDLPNSDNWQIVIFIAGSLEKLSCTFFLSGSKACLISKSLHYEWGRLWWKTHLQNVQSCQFWYHEVHHSRVNLSDKELVPWKFIFYLWKKMAKQNTLKLFS